MSAVKYSRQREAIREYLASANTHPTADMVYSHIRKDHPNISLGTVYRNLNLLVEQGDAIKLSCGDGIDRFDYNTSDHSHFICRSCGKILDLEMESHHRMGTNLPPSFEGSIDRCIIYFYGTCPECIKNS